MVLTNIYLSIVTTELEIHIYVRDFKKIQTQRIRTEYQVQTQHNSFFIIEFLP